MNKAITVVLLALSVFALCAVAVTMVVVTVPAVEADGTDPCLSIEPPPWCFPDEPIGP